MERETVPGYCLVSKPVNRSSVEWAIRGPMRHVTPHGCEPWPRIQSSVQYKVKQRPLVSGPWPGKETGLPGPDWRQLAGLDESHTRRPPASARHSRSGTTPFPRTAALNGMLNQVENLNGLSHPTRPRTSDSRTRTSSLPSRSTSVVPYFS